MSLLLEEEALVDAQDNEGNTPLWYAVSDGYLESVELLLSHNADPNIKNNTVLPAHVLMEMLIEC